MEDASNHENILLFENFLVNDGNQAGSMQIVLGNLSDKKI